MDIATLNEERINPSTEHYVTPGRHIHAIGSQNGGFPTFGHHVEHEMGGVWMHPIKLLDGYWLSLSPMDGERDWLIDADRFSNHAYYMSMDFTRPRYMVTRREVTSRDTAGLLVRYAISNTSDAAITLHGRLAFTTDLQPVWYSEESGMHAGQDYLTIDKNDFIGTTENHDWAVRLRLEGAETVKTIADKPLGPEPVYGLNAHGCWDFKLTIPEGEQRILLLKVTGSLLSINQTAQRMSMIDEYDSVTDCQRNVYQGLLDRSAIETPDQRLNLQYAWVNIHTEWLTVESEATGRALAAGIPEYTWWFGCDSAYSIKGILPAGFFDLSKRTVETLNVASETVNGNGRIIHEENTFGYVGNRGNTQETALYVHAIHEIYRWTGDLEWVASLWGSVKQGLRWLLEDQDQDGDLFPEGYGIMEVLGLDGELIDTAVYTQVALENAAELGELLDDEDTSRYAELAHLLANRIREEMWMPEEGLFADLRIQPSRLREKLSQFSQQAVMQHDDHLVKRYESLARRLDEYSDDDSEKPWCFKNWVIDTPLEMSIATPNQALASLERLNGPEFIGRYGMYVSGEAQSMIMTISSASLINANLAYGQADQALRLINLVMDTFNLYLPGSINEVAAGNGCFVQAWTAYAIISPLVTGFLGINPDAYNHVLRVNPCLPSDWDAITVRNIQIGDTLFDIAVHRNGSGYDTTVTYDSDTTGEWTVISEDALNE